jgi:hypothetical protein
LFLVAACGAVGCSGAGDGDTLGWRQLDGYSFQPADQPRVGVSGQAAGGAESRPRPADAAAAAPPAGNAAATKSARQERAAALRKLPLPTHTIEGYGGGAIVPVAYLVNPGKEGEVFGLPAASFANLIAGHKNLQTFAATETLFRRVELGYGLDRVGLGTLNGDIRERTGADIDTNHVWLHNFNIRGLFLEDNPDAFYVPGLAGGVHVKVNDGIDDINNRLHGALTRLGYDSPCGVDFTLTLSKTVEHPLTLNRPLSGTIGMRASEAAVAGAVGFGDQYSLTVEAAVGYLITDHLGVKYEFRQNNYPYSEAPNLFEAGDNWHAIGASLILNEHLTVDGGWGRLGTLSNSVENCVWWLQVKYEF